MLTTATLISLVAHNVSVRRGGWEGMKDVRRRKLRRGRSEEGTERKRGRGRGREEREKGRVRGRGGRKREEEVGAGNWC